MAHDAQGKEDAGRTRSTLHRDDEPPRWSPGSDSDEVVRIWGENPGSWESRYSEGLLPQHLGHGLYVHSPYASYLWSTIRAAATRIRTTSKGKGPSACGRLGDASALRLGRRSSLSRLYVCILLGGQAPWMSREHIGLAHSPGRCSCHCSLVLGLENMRQAPCVLYGSCEQQHGRSRPEADADRAASCQYTM